MSGLDAQNRPQILEHLQKSLTVTVYDTKCACSGVMSSVDFAVSWVFKPPHACQLLLSGGYPAARAL